MQCHRKPTRSRRKAITGLAVLAAAAAASLNVALPSAAQPTREARAAHVIDGTATAHLHLVRADGAQLYEEGPVVGALPGKMQTSLSTGATLTGSFTVHLRHGGTIEGRGVATPHGSGRYQSFSGTLNITGGTGLYKHAHGQAGLYGVFDRRTYALVIQTTGRFFY